MSSTTQFFNLADVSRLRLVALRDAPPVLYRTGLARVDEMLRGGISPGEVCIVAALTSHGKTMFMQNWVYSLARDGIKTATISEEMTIESLADRSIDYAASVPKDERRQRWEDTFDDVIKFYEDRVPILACKPCRHADNAADAIAQAATHHGVKVVFVDYLQKLRGKGEDDVSRLAYASGVLQAAAVEHNVAVVIGAQLNRSATQEGPFSPRVHQIKGASAIEQDASAILMLVYPWQLEKSKPRTEYHVFCGKNRNRGIGGRGFCQLKFEPERQRLTSPGDAAATCNHVDPDTFVHRDGKAYCGACDQFMGRLEDEAGSRRF